MHYTFVDGHQHDYFCRVVEDGVAGSSRQAHEASLAAMAYLQRDARCTAAQVHAAFEQLGPDQVGRPPGLPPLAT